MSKIKFFLLFLTFVSGILTAEVSQSEIDSVISRAQNNVKNIQIDNEYWLVPAYLGTHYISQYYLLSKWLEYKSPNLSEKHLKDILLSTQLTDGSWYAIKDANLSYGDLNATIYNYWALKVMGEDLNSLTMTKARDFILSRGGLDKSSLFVRIVLCLFGNYEWDRIPNIPLMIFSDNFPVDTNQYFAQWIGPHLMPIAYIRTNKIVKNLGEKFALQEIRTNTPEIPFVRPNFAPRKISLEMMINEMLERQQPRGSFGGYTVSTIFTIISFEHFKTKSTLLNKKINIATERGFDFIEKLYFKSGDSSYLGVLDDGRYWDTALIGQGLLESKIIDENLYKAADYLVKYQNKDGSFAYGEDFWYAPDIDDTAEIILFLHPLKRYQTSVKKATEWMLKMQNRDGGFGAFFKNNQGNFLVNSIFKPFEDSADLFDESCPDITGHVIEALAMVGYNKNNSKAVRKAIKYLKKSQDDENSAWLGRWGLGYIYGTSAAIVGLIKAGEDPGTPYLHKAVHWLLAHQNDDGGFGETTLADTKQEYAGIGVSTPTQTAWAVLALIEAKEQNNIKTQKAIEYLLNSFNKYNKWVDESTVGTGHPGIVYMNYPAYPYAFPLIALARYNNLVGE